jgi:hypothetical protein
LSNFLVNPYLEAAIIDTNLVNGSNYTVNNSVTPATALSASAGSDDTYAYDSIPVNQASATVKYYYNGSLLHTSDNTTSSNLYAKAHSYWLNTKAGMEKTVDGYKWTVLGDPNNWVYNASGASVIGLEDTTSGSGRATNQYSFKFQDNVGDKLYLVEDGSTVLSYGAITVALNDTFEIKWG